MTPSLLQTPLLLWVDDHAKRGDTATHIAYARQLGIHVHVLESTATAQEWILHNIGKFSGESSDGTDFLRATNDSKDLKAVRLCTDYVRVEDNGQGVDLNLDAGYDIAKFFHDRVPNLPLLVYTHDYNIMNTKFVKHWPAAGSTCDKLVVRQFIDEMVSEGDNELAWAVFDAKAETATKA